MMADCGRACPTRVSGQEESYGCRLCVPVHCTAYPYDSHHTLATLDQSQALPCDSFVTAIRTCYRSLCVTSTCIDKTAAHACCGSTRFSVRSPALGTALCIALGIQNILSVIHRTSCLPRKSDADHCDFPHVLSARCAYIRFSCVVYECSKSIRFSVFYRYPRAANPAGSSCVVDPRMR